MAITIDKSCTRCRRTERKPVTDIAAAQADEALEKKRAENLKKIHEFIKAIPANERPIIMLFQNDKAVAHTHLCDGDGPKSSCVNRVAALVDDLDVLPERKPRTKKEKPAEAAPAAATGSTPAEAPTAEKGNKKGNKK
jgi:hypothetical protein